MKNFVNNSNLLTDKDLYKIYDHYSKQQIMDENENESVIEETMKSIKKNKTNTLSPKLV